VMIFYILFRVVFSHPKHSASYSHLDTSVSIGVASGCSGCTCSPRAEKFFRRYLQGKLVSAPQAHQVHSQARVNFRTFLLDGGDLEVGVVHLVVLDRLTRATTKKGRQLFLGKKCTPRQNPGHAYE